MTSPNTCTIRLVVTAVAALLLPTLAPAGIDLTPHFTDVFVEGATSHRLYFTDGDKKFVVSLNRETEVSADSGGALFRFPKVPEASFLVVRSRHSPTDKFEGNSLDRYRESARRLLPVQARGVTILGEVPDAFPINDWTSYRVTLAFDVGVIHHLQNVTFLNLNDTDQIVLITAAPEKDFEEAAHRSYQIFRTWQETVPGDERANRGS